MQKNERAGLRTWIEIDRKAIGHNFGVFKKLISPKTKLMAVVKSNAYGHDLIQFSKEMEKLGADFLGVDSITEARALRREGVKLPILVLGYTMPELFAEAAKDDISLAVSTFETLEAIAKAKLPKTLKIHIKVDTGMRRQGFLLSDLPLVLKKLKAKSYKLKAVPEGLFTHFAAAKNPAFPKDTKNQIEEFKKWITAFADNDIRPIVHAAATGGTLLFPEAHFDMVRIGIGLYGLWPERAVKSYLRKRITLHPILSWRSFVTETKVLPKGSRVGYDLTETLLRPSTIAVIPIGYWHGYPRALSAIGHISVRGQNAKILGRVSMDMISIDITGIAGVQVGDEVTILGADDTSPASAEGMAGLLDASWYEIVTRLNPLIKRIYK
ncbi:MAG: Alanine racemase [Parcubacteria group bacterium GW2011_GWA2_49_9]|nr:MAG: Alanine racemase [Parcubacteria group bacterium GW2011_GWA2_49_9]